MPFRLVSLLKYRTHQRDLCRQYLAEVLATDQQFVDEIAILSSAREAELAELREKSSSGKLAIDTLRALRYHVGQLHYDILSTEQKRILVGQQIQLCRQALIQADQKVKALEKLRDKQAMEEQSNRLKREGQEVEETWRARNAMSQH